MPLRLLLLLSLLCALLITCNDKPTRSHTPRPFRLTVTISDSLGNPVPGLLVSVWNDTIRFDPFPQFEASAAKPASPSSTGDVNCDGEEFTQADAEILKAYLVGDTSQLGDALECLHENGDIVPASPGITAADYYYCLKRSSIHTMPPASSLVARAGEYVYWENGFGGMAGLLPQPDLEAIYAVFQVPDTFTYHATYREFGYEEIIDARGGRWRMLWSPVDLQTNFDGELPIGDKVGGPGRLISIEGVTSAGAPVIYHRIAHEGEIWIDYPCPSESLVTIETYLPYQYTKPVMLIVTDLYGQRVDSVWFPTGEGPLTWGPPSRYPTVYQFTFTVFEEPDVTLTEFDRGAVWQDEPAFNVVGISNASGAVVVTDKLRFPSLFDPWTFFQRILGARADFWFFTDSISVALRDTVSGALKLEHFPLSDGENSVEVVWP